MDVVKLWEKIKKIMKKRVNEGEFELFFENVEATKLEESVFTLTCNSKLIKENMEKYKSQMEEIIEIVTDEEVTINFEIKKQDVMSYKPETHSFPKETMEKASLVHTGLNPKHRLDNFVVGENSKLAYNACLAVVKNPTVYNPLFIFGSSGLGKTHLMQAVGNAILENDPSKRVYYSTSEEFANEFFKVLNSGRIQHFRDTFRALDVLLLDDIQFFEKVFGRGEGTVEEEFFHTFNKLQELGKQIIMISDKSPKEIKNLSKRLESRFLSGLTVEIQSPGYETRMMILKNMAKAQGIEIDDSILEYISDSLDTNVRELEGTLTNLNARAKLLDEQITLELVQEMLMHNVKREQSKVTAKKVIEMISAQYGVSVTDMKSKKRQKKIVETRQIAMYLLKNNDELDLSLTAIGGLFGGKDHSTVISSIRKIDKKTKEDVAFKKEIESLNKKIFRA
ncbi:chromosomal replication initiator protein DnaA [Leptotrichia hongkongensis]|jgi:chromosomal replication initiator protein dnaA|uniref:Chromosomal replication initiator protein DnaA n=1 Tax=Leptotrichia hongkongensis TaxID=554406 RepID=A0A510L4R1_9FUSO|nr:chromosomal replication initiator protein DnaA [Leptotrichia hongkongensis]BBM58439.1 chromosomal replication initiator protein DnaA [Leptotrichia hongkongensis]